MKTLLILAVAAIAASAQPTGLPTAVDKTWEALKSGRCEAAVKPLDEALAQNPQNPLLHYARGVCLVRSGEIPGAVAAFKTSVDLDPEFPDSWHYLRRYIGAADPEALKFFKKRAGRNKKRNAHIHLNYALLLHRAKREPEAQQSMARALQINPAYAEAHLQLGLMKLEKGRTDEAVASFEKAKEIDPSYAEAYTALFQTLRRKGEPAAKLEALRDEAIRLKPELSQVIDEVTPDSQEDPKAAEGREVVAPFEMLLSPLLRIQDNKAPFSTLFSPYFKVRSKLKERYKTEIRWTAARNPEALPIDPLENPQAFQTSVALGGRRLLWAFFTTPNILFLAEPAGEGKVHMEIRMIPPSQRRFDPEGSVIYKGELGRGEFADLDQNWAASVEAIGVDEVVLKINKKG